MERYPQIRQEHQTLNHNDWHYIDEKVSQLSKIVKNPEVNQILSEIRTFADSVLGGNLPSINHSRYLGRRHWEKIRQTTWPNLDLRSITSDQMNAQLTLDDFFYYYQKPDKVRYVASGHTGNYKTPFTEYVEWSAKDNSWRIKRYKYHTEPCMDMSGSYEFVQNSEGMFVDNPKFFFSKHRMKEIVRSRWLLKSNEAPDPLNLNDTELQKIAKSIPEETMKKRVERYLKKHNLYEDDLGGYVYNGQPITTWELKID